MKKIIIFLIVFALIAFIVTFILIKLTNEKIISKNITDVITSVISNEKTIDLYGTYDENDLTIEKKIISIDDIEFNIEIPQINGLKDKVIEQKVNRNIEQKIIKTINECKDKSGSHKITNDNSYINYYNYANFANVISFSFELSFETIDAETNERLGTIYESIGLNYNLVDGEELKIEDLFKSKEDVEDMARIAFNRFSARSEQNEYDGENEPYYDMTSGKWFRIENIYNEKNDTWEEKEVEYNLQENEYEISKKFKQFIKEPNVNFYFSCNKIYFRLNEKDTYDYYYFYSVPFEDIADKVVIYNKYLTKDSIFEKDDIGVKGLIMCSSSYGYKNYHKTKFESDNFFYDIDVSDFYCEDDYPYKEVLEDKIREIYEKGESIIDEYKEKASDDKSQAYFLFIRVNPSISSYNNEYYNLITVDLGQKEIVCDIEDKQEYLDIILSKYRYYNLGFYGGIYDFLYEDSESNILNVIEKVEGHAYNTTTEKEIKSVEELFKPEVDYKEIIITKINENDLYTKQLTDNDDIEYEISTSGIQVEVSNEYYGYVNYEKIIDYLNFEIIKTKILPSDERNIYEYDLISMTLEELNYAYNEIFARHGHDFKNQKYKDYFSQFSWYVPVESKVVSLEELTDIERENAKIIKSYIDNFGVETNDY